MIDRLAVDAWTEFIDLRKRGLIDRLDELSQDVIFAVAAAQLQGREVTSTDILVAVHHNSAFTLNARLSKLCQEGFLQKNDGRVDRRRATFSLTDRSKRLINLYSQVFRNQRTDISYNRRKA